MSKEVLRNAYANVVNKQRNHHDAEHDNANAFVRKHQAEMKAKYGGHAHLAQEAMNTDAYMCNDGVKAGEFGKKLTKGLDEKAFPVNK